MSDVDRFLNPDLVAQIEGIVDERVRELLAPLSEANTASPWFSIASAAAYVGVSERKVARLIRGRASASTGS